MSEFCAPPRLLSLSLHVCFSLLSRPLYLSYLIFFFPYLLALLSFLFPLLATVFLLLLAIYTLSPSPFSVECSDVSATKDGCFSTFQRLFDDFEACKCEDGENPDEVPVKICEDKAEIFPPVNFLLLMKDVEENKEPGNIRISEFKKIEEGKAILCVKENPNEAGDDINSSLGPSNTKSMVESDPLGQSINGGSSSMRKEREWRRTLAGKLYEERHKVEEGSEGMDLLWETYEKESSISKKNRRSSSRKCRNGGLEQAKKEEENVEDEDITGDLCCLQAFKLSAGKMNLGIGRSNLVKFSKALKEIGWFHQVKIKHGRKSSSLS